MQQTSTSVYQKDRVDLTLGRVIAAFLIAPSIGPVGIVLTFFIPALFSAPDPGKSILVLPFIYLFVAPFVYFFSFLLGIPFFLSLRAAGMLGMKALTVGWAVIGAVSLVLLFALLSGGQSLGHLGDSLVLAPFALSGAAVGYLFWRILTWKVN